MIKKYQYNPRLSVYFLCTLFFLGLALFIGYRASHNDKGISVYNIIYLNAYQADYFLWGGFCCLMIMVFIGIYGMITRLMHGKVFLEIHEDYFFVPKFVFNKEKKVFFKSIGNIQKQEIHGTIHYIFVVHGEKISITNRAFDSNDKFEEAAGLIISQTKKNKGSF